MEISLLCPDLNKLSQYLNPSWGPVWAMSLSLQSHTFHILFWNCSHSYVEKYDMSHITENAFSCLHIECIMG
jgi:hypothetical protein